MTVNRNEERVAEGTNWGGPSRPVGKKLSQRASASRQVQGKASGPGKKSGKGRRPSKAERSQDAASGRKRRFFNYPRAGKGKIHRWIPSWRFVLGTFLLGVLSMVGAFMWAYNTIKVPKPSEFALAQSSTVYYADGSTEMGKFAEINRESVDASTLPDYVGNSVVASEDRSFYSNKGVDPKGIARALVNNLRGGDTQGASTLTQQYVKNYYVDTTSSYSGKFKQAIMAIKIDREKPKKAILGDYLNTVYFGRGAYGIEAASKSFFGKPAKDLSPSEAALLAGILPSPSAWDPAENPEKAQERWGRVLQFMADDGYITSEQYNTAKQAGMPKTQESQTKQVYAGTNGYLLQMVRAELQSKAKLTPEQVDTGGFKIITTINPKDQEAAVNAVNSLPPGASPNLRKALVSIDPKTGGLLALYGGEDYLTSQVNTSTDAIAQAGSTFKPFALVAALENGWSLGSGYPATSPMTIEGHEFQNFKNVSLKWASLTQATEQSLNTPYLQLNQELMNAEDIEEGVTAKVANRAGYPEATEGLKTPEQRTLVQNVLGSASPHTIDIASAYSTFAAQGIRRDTHIVASLKNPDGTERYKADTAGHREFEEDVMADTTYALQQVVSGPNGSADKVAAQMDRPVAAKTGSSSDNKSAQFVGFTPQVVTAVTLYQTGTDGSEESIEPWGEYDEITGATYPADIFINYMKVAHEGLEVEDFPEAADIPATRGGTVPETANPAGEPEEEATTTPTAPPEATATPTPQPTTEPTPQGTPQPDGKKTEQPDSPKKPGDGQDDNGGDQNGGNRGGDQGGEDSAQAADRDGDARPPGIGHPADERAPNRRRPQEEHHVDAQDPAAHGRLGGHLHGLVGAGQEREDAQAHRDRHEGESQVGGHDGQQEGEDSQGEGRHHDRARAGAAAPGRPQGTGEGPDGEDRGDGAVGVGLQVEDGAHGRGHGDLEVEGEHGDDGDHGDDDDEISAAAQVNQALTELSGGTLGAGHVHELAHAHGGQGGGREEEGGGVDGEDPAGTHPGDDDAGECRPQEPGGVEGGGVEAHGVGQVLGGHHPGHEGLAGRSVVGGGEAPEEGGQVDVPQARGAGQDVDGDDGGDQAHGALGEDEELALVDPVGDESGVGGEQEHGEELQGRGQAGGGGGVVGEDAQHQPVLRHALHPGPGVGHEGGQEPDPVVVESQGGEDATAGAAR